MRHSIYVLALLVLAAGCAQEAPAPEETTPDAPAAEEAPAPADIASNPLRNAYFGDTHIHTVLSFDAYLMGTRRTPDEAYDFAKGEAIEHAAGRMMQLHAPLDFLAVSDHAFYLGMMQELADETSAYGDHPVASAVRGATDAEGSGAGFQAVVGHLREGFDDPGRVDDLDDRNVARSAWQEIIESAERNNEPGSFTAFIGYEYTSSGPETQNLHRNVIFRGSEVPRQPFSRLDSLNPEDLWTWMDTNRDAGMDALAIPHNSNGSDGWMFRDVTFAGDPLDAGYADLRMRNVPIVENTQVKGTSDTHPALSMNDEWAGFEIDPYVAGGGPLTIAKTAGGYVRDAMKKGLLLEAEGLGNPFEYGFIGSSDTHTGAGSYDETNFFSKVGLLDSTAALRGSVPISDDDLTTLGLSDAEDSAFYVASDGRRYLSRNASVYGASGLAAVWAEENTRESIYDAFRRKEAFATSGPRMQVRFFAGHGLDSTMLETADGISRAYIQGVSMGGDLVAKPGDAPAFVVWAARDAQSAPLQRVQIIKGWLEDGETHERVFDVACSDGLAVDPATHRCPDNGAKVNLSDCAISADRGAVELKALWHDPEFDGQQRAFYYARVLENPTCRWSTWDALRAGVAPREDLGLVIQERAWSSPIWMIPHGAKAL